MNGRVLDFAMHTHHEAQRLLPWLANGTLESGERGWLQEHLDHCADCRRGLQDLLALRAAILESGPSPADADAGWQRMVSQATRARLSCARIASSTASEIWSATLSGWPSETDSEVNR